MTLDQIIDKYSDYYTNHEQYDYYQTCIKLNRSEFLSLVEHIYNDIIKDVPVDITPKPINPETIDYTIR